MHLPSRTVLRRSPWLNSAVRESNVRGLDLNSLLSRNKSTIRKVTQVSVLSGNRHVRSRSTMQVYNIYVDRFHCNVTHSKDFTIQVLGFRSEGPLP